MCDTIAAVPAQRGAPVWFAKNSDREPGEPQLLEHLPSAPARGTHVDTTWMRIPQASATHEVVLSRPAWMWGAEMGVNAHGVAIGNEATFTRLPVAERGLTGMDLLRLAVERATSADEALERIVWLLARHGQGGRCGFRDTSFRYHSSFLIADHTGAWVLETADRFWAAMRVRGVATISNALTIDAPDRIGSGTLDAARSLGFWDGKSDFSFRRAFGRPGFTFLAGAVARRTSTRAAMRGADDGAGVDLARCAAALRHHGGREPHEGLRMGAACAHAAVWPTRSAGQTTASLVASLGAGAPRSWATGTSSPCLSVLKPIPLGAGSVVDFGPAPPSGHADRASLFWRHERLHRAVMQRPFADAVASFEPARSKLEASAWAIEPDDVGGASAVFAAHREVVAEWAEAVASTAPRPARGASERVSRWYWSRESAREGM